MAHDDAESAARLLWERVRRGALDPDRLRLAAYIGDRVARLALGAQAPETPGELTKLVRGLEPWGKEALVRAALAAALRSLHLLDAAGWSRDAVEAAGAWLRAPGEEVATRVAVVSAAAPGLQGDAGDALHAALQMITTRARTSFARAAVELSVRALEKQRRVEFPADEVLVAVREALIRWALGGSDPLLACGPPADRALWTSRPDEAPLSADRPASPWPFPRHLERNAHGDFFVDRRDGQRWLGVEQPDGRRWFLAPFPPREARTWSFGVSDDLAVVSWAERLGLDDAVEVRRSSRGVIATSRVACAGQLEDLAVSPSGERVVWVTSHADPDPGQPDRLWHLDLRPAQPEPRRVPTEHAVIRALHFPTHCAVGFITDRAAWDACEPAERKTALLGRHLVRMELLT